MGEKSVPKFGVIAGIGGIVSYLLGFIPALVGVFIYAAIKFNNDSANDSALKFEDVLSDLTTSLWVIIAVLLSQSIVFLTYAFLVSKFRGSGSFVKDYGLRFNWYSPGFIFVGIGLQIAGIILGFPLLLLKDGDAPQQEIVRSVEESKGAAFIVFAILVALLVPLIEEICFRGLFQRGLSRSTKPVVAILISAILFAVVHLADPNVSLALTQLLLVGLACAIFTAYTGRIDAAIFTHVGFNLTTVLLIAFFR